MASPEPLVSRTNTGPSHGPSQPGDELGRYRLLKKIARGGMAEVFAARSFGAHGFEKTVALKRILPRYGQDPQFVRMMVDEAKITVTLNHPNVATVFELGEQDGDYFIVMEFVPGQSLSSVNKKLRDEGEHIGALEACFVVVELLQGLHAAHVQKDANGQPAHIIHRDVSPQNVLLSFDGRVKVIDFGIARARSRLERTEVGTIKGKLRYLAPEMIDPARFMKTGDFDHRVDVFAAGIVLWEMIANKTLYQGDDEMVVYDAITGTDAPDLLPFGNCDAELAAIVKKALTRDPELRFLTAEEFADALRAYVYRTDPSFTHKRLANLLARMFPVEKEEMLSLERGQGITVDPERPRRDLEPEPVAPDAPTKTLGATSTEPTKEMRASDSRQRPDLDPAHKGAAHPSAAHPSAAQRGGREKSEPGLGDVVTMTSLVSRTDSADRGGRPSAAETLTSAAQPMLTPSGEKNRDGNDETPYTSDRTFSALRKINRGRPGVLVLAAVVGVAIGLAGIAALSVSRSKAPPPTKIPDLALVDALPVSVTVTSTTQGAIAHAQGAERPVPATFLVPAGTNVDVVVSAPGYSERTSKMSIPPVGARDQTLDVALSPAPVPLLLTVIPYTALVLVGNTEALPYLKGMRVEPGKPLMVQASAPGFESVRREIEVKIGEPVVVTIELKAQSAPDARVAPVAPVAVRRPALPPPVRAGTETKVPEAARPSPSSAKQATLVLKTKALWGEVTIDGKKYDETTPLTVELKPGKHTVLVAHPPKKLKKSFTITLKPGETLSKTITFE